MMFIKFKDGDKLQIGSNHILDLPSYYPSKLSVISSYLPGSQYNGLHDSLSFDGGKVTTFDWMSVLSINESIFRYESTFNSTLGYHVQFPRKPMMISTLIRKLFGEKCSVSHDRLGRLTVVVKQFPLVLNVSYNMHITADPFTAQRCIQDIHDFIKEVHRFTQVNQIEVRTSPSHVAAVKVSNAKYLSITLSSNEREFLFPCLPSASIEAAVTCIPDYSFNLDIQEGIVLHNEEPTLRVDLQKFVTAFPKFTFREALATVAFTLGKLGCHFYVSNKDIHTWLGMMNSIFESTFISLPQGGQS